MRLLSILCALLLLLLPWHTAAAQDQFPEQAIKTLIDCYNNAKDKNDEVVQCINTKTRVLANPLDYHLTIRTAEPNPQGQFKVVVFMINNAGHMVYCLGTANNTSMAINSCAAEQGEPLSASQMLSIDPLPLSI